ncbi:redox-sensing transcriptional repressor Rex [Candidatus Fermentibacteria bacterium]|nr:MAG: redox-sensing transcriptional repressor Rex [Candidatus Fermentibacteria bacterium]
MPGKKVSEKTIRRLSHYARCLRIARADGIPIVTSKHLSERCGISSAAVRKDLAVFGEFGKQGSGYGVSDLLENIEGILGTCKPPPVIVIGAGNIGSALLESGLDGTGGYSYSAIFDSDPKIIGKTIAGVTVQPIAELREVIGAYGDVIAILAVSPGSGQNAVDNLVNMGCISILSFTLEPLNVPEGVVLRYIEVSTELDILTHSMKCRE